MENFNFDNSAMELTIYKLRDTLLTLINDITEGHDTEEDIEIPYEVNDIKTRLFALIKEFEDVLDEPLDKRQDFIKSAQQLKGDILTLADAANTYTVCVQQMGDYVLDKVKEKDISSMPESLMNNSFDITAEIGMFLDSITDEERLSQAKSLLISAVPMRMPRASYNDLVTSSLVSNFEGLSLNFIQHSLTQMKSFMCGRKTETYGHYFKSITERINDVYSLNTDKLGIADLNDYLDDADYCISVLTNTFAILSVYYSDVNFLLILASYAIDHDFLFDDDFVFKDLYYGMLDYIDNEDVPATAVNEGAVSMIEELYTKFKPKEEQLKHHISKLSVDEVAALDTSLQTVLNTYLVIDRLYKELLDYALMGSYDNVSNESATPAEMKKACADITENVTQLISDLPIKEQKYLKQHFLSRIPCLYKKEDLLNYISFSLEGITDDKNKWITYGNIFEIFDKFGFKADDKK